MVSTQDTEITLGTGKLLVLFFGLVAICAVFFGLGYSLGRKSEPGLGTVSAAAPQQNIAPATKSSGSSTTAQPMGFYKAVEQKEATADLTPATATKTDSTAVPANPAENPPAPAPQTSNAVDPSTTVPSGGYFVQVAAVSKQEDADSLVDALKKKDYPAFVAAGAKDDKLFRVQLGPFADVKEAEGMRAKLVGDGYSPILKK
jgi:DedD protein